MSLIRKAFKRLHYPTDIMAQCVRWYLAYALSLRNLEEMMAERGIDVDHSTLHRWLIRSIPLIDKTFRRHKRSVGRRWRMDETYIKIKGQWKYLYRAVDTTGQTIDFLLTAKLQQITVQMKQENRTVSSEARSEPLSLVMEKVADTLPNIAIEESKGLGKGQRDSVYDAVAMARAQGRDVAVVTVDKTGLTAFSRDTRFASVPLKPLSEVESLKSNSTLVLANAEKLSLKTALSVLEMAKDANGLCRINDESSKGKCSD